LRSLVELLAEWDRRYPGRIENAFNALARVVPSHLMDGRLFDFRGLAATGAPDPDWDTAFDQEEPPAAASTQQIVRLAD
jgi:tRNA 2-thiocytidine biosynthesis protein TtcA